ncbi:hypothetical protein [Streptomyces sp. Root1310]|uniref:hypothetical protein n=1 Tax=Streptomyces sp. Root1310 TaxID=1736452 RepID=UPI00072A8F10|nr:hypothetical protein [Streptomyces sp. Root1310]KQX62246.1 hypothetical protein ASD48_26820 [Streptomyces sp. Root1310]
MLGPVSLQVPRTGAEHPRTGQPRQIRPSRQTSEGEVPAGAVLVEEFDEEDEEFDEDDEVEEFEAEFEPEFESEVDDCAPPVAAEDSCPLAPLAPPVPPVPVVSVVPAVPVGAGAVPSPAEDPVRCRGTEGTVAGEEACESGWVFVDAGVLGEGEARCAPERLTVGRLCSRVGSSPPAVVGVSGTVAACAWSPLWRSSAAKVRPPPTRATAVATTARRWFFFQRANCRRRAARPCGAWGTDGADGTLSDSGDGTADDAADDVVSAYVVDASVSRGGVGSGTGVDIRIRVVVATRAGAMPRSTVTGAMSGA